MNRKVLGRGLLAAVASLALAGAANASIIPVLTGGPTLSGGTYLYTYTATLDGDQGMVNGSTLAIYDFAGYVPGSFTTSNAGFTFSNPATAPGLTAGNPLPGASDSAAINDLVFTWNGGNFLNTAVHDPVDFTFTVRSTLGTIATDGFGAVAVKDNGPQIGTTTANYGYVAVAAAVPETATWGMMILGMGMVGMGLRLRRRHAPVLA